MSYCMDLKKENAELKREIERLRKSVDTALASCEVELAQARKRIKELSESLQIITDFKGKTLLGEGSPIEDRAHQIGANKAFEEAAAIAYQALQGEKDD